MRNEKYDKMLFDAIKRLKNKLSITPREKQKINVFNDILYETDKGKLEIYYNIISKFLESNDDIIFLELHRNINKSEDASERLREKNIEE